MEEFEAYFLVSILETPANLRGVSYETGQHLFQIANFDNLKTVSTHKIQFDWAGEKHIEELAALLGDGLQVHLLIQVFIEEEEAGLAEIHSLVDDDPEINVPRQMAEDIFDTVILAIDGFTDADTLFGTDSSSIFDNIIPPQWKKYIN